MPFELHAVATDENSSPLPGACDVAAVGAVLPAVGERGLTEQHRPERGHLLRDLLAAATEREMAHSSIKH